MLSPRALTAAGAGAGCQIADVGAIGYSVSKITRSTCE